MNNLYESDVEKLALALLQDAGYVYLSPEEIETERADTRDVLLRGRLKAAIANLNPDSPALVREQALRQVADLASDNPLESNKLFYEMLVEGVPGELSKDGETVGMKTYLIDFENPLNNDFVVENQFSVTQNNISKRPDIVLFVNGLPLVVIELKNPTDEQATTKKRLTNCKTTKRKFLICSAITACWRCLTGLTLRPVHSPRTGRAL